MSDWSSTFWASTAGLFGEEDEGDTFDPDQQVASDLIFLTRIASFRYAWFNFIDNYCPHPPGNLRDKSTPSGPELGNCLMPSCHRGRGNGKSKMSSRCTCLVVIVVVVKSCKLLPSIFFLYIVFIF